MGADGWHVLHFPGASAVTISPAGECPNWTYIDAHSAFFAFEVIFPIGNDHGLRTSVANSQSLDIHSFVTHADTAEAQNATGRVVIDEIGPLLLRPVQLFFGKATAV